MRHAEVGQLGRSPAPAPAPRHQHVRRLDVAVDDALRVGVRQRVAQRDAHLDDVAVGQLALLEQGVERAAANELGDQVGALVVDRGLIERDDRRVLRAARPRGPRARSGRATTPAHAGAP